MQTKRLLISGIVQGVGFRYFARRAARSLGVRGWVRNLNDGRVEIVATAPDEAMREFIEEVRTGPGGAQVQNLDAQDAGPQPEMEGFEIRY